MWPFKKKLPAHHVDPEDMFADTRMSFADHLGELQDHLWRAVSGFLIAMVVGLFLSPWTLKIIVAPVEQQLQAFYERAGIKNAKNIEIDMATRPYRGKPLEIQIKIERHEFLRQLGINEKMTPREKDALDTFREGYRQIFGQIGIRPLGASVNLPVQIDDPRPLFVQVALNKTTFDPGSLKTLGVTEAFMVYFKVAMLVGLVLGSPWIFFEIWSFVAAGLYPQEKRLVNVYLPVSIGLFIFGVLTCQFLVMPKAVEALLWFNEWLGYSPDLRLNEWISFAVMMPVVFGVSFQTPMVMLFLNRLGVMDGEAFRKHRNVAWFIMAIVAAIITPTVDAISMLYLWVPMGLLYELGIWLCLRQPKEALDELENDRTFEEMVEV